MLKARVALMKDRSSWRSLIILKSLWLMTLSLG